MKLAAFFLLTAMNAVAVEVIAHRGFSAKAPENSVAAFELAWQHGADACELDIHLTADQQIVVIHDKDTKRTHPGENKVIAASTLAELPPIPTLAQALATMPKERGRFFIEIKCGPEVIPALTKELELWKPRSQQLAIISFNREACALAKKAMPHIPVFQLAGGKDKEKQPRTDLAQLIAQAQSDKLDGLDLGSDWPWSEAMVQQIRAAGLGVFVWTINKPDQAHSLDKLGVDGITTDDPVMVRASVMPN